MKTKDYGLTCLLLCKGHCIERYSNDDAGQVWFEFPDSGSVEKIVSDFFMNKASVLVGDFLSAEKRVKNIIFGKENQYGNGNERGSRNR